MLSFEKIEAKDLAYDRITPKMIKFLAKHYQLTNYIPQNNGFTIFSQFFGDSFKKTQLSNFGENIMCRYNN